MVDPLAEVVALLKPQARFSKLVLCVSPWRVRRSDAIRMRPGCFRRREICSTANRDRYGQAIPDRGPRHEVFRELSRDS